MSDYPKFGSISRRYREITITEKIDGTNGLISIEKEMIEPDIPFWKVRAGSRNRWLTLEDDNFGFARWVNENHQTLVADLGEGMHYGEWWGSGIQRGYGLTKGEKRFSLFNVKRWSPRNEETGFLEPFQFQTPNLAVVPVIMWSMPNSDFNIDSSLNQLRVFGSFASEGFMNPEGIVIWDHAARIYQKVTLENDGVPKSKV